MPAKKHTYGVYPSEDRLDAIISHLEQAARSQTGPVELSKESRAWLMTYFTAGAALVRKSFLDLPLANQLELWRSEFIRFSADERWVEFTLKARSRVVSWLGKHPTAAQTEKGEPMAQQPAPALTARLRELLQFSPSWPNDVAEVYDGCRELLDVVEAAERFCVARTGGRRFGENVQTYRGRRAEAFTKLREKVRAVTQPRSAPPTSVCALVAKIDKAVEVFNSELSRAYGNGFTWELLHLELNEVGSTCATPRLDVNLYANVSTGCNDTAREWPSEKKTAESVRWALGSLNRVMAETVKAGYICRLEPIQDKVRQVETIKVSMLKQY